MDNIQLPEDIKRAVMACKDIKTCTLDVVCSPLIGRCQSDLLRMTGTMEQLMIAQVVYYAQSVCELSYAHINSGSAACEKIVDTLLRMPVIKPPKPPKERKEEDADGARRAHTEAAIVA